MVCQNSYGYFVSCQTTAKNIIFLENKEATTRLCYNIHQWSIAFRSDLSQCRFNNRISVLIFSVLK